MQKKPQPKSVRVLSILKMLLFSSGLHGSYKTKLLQISKNGRIADTTFAIKAQTSSILQMLMPILRTITIHNRMRHLRKIIIWAILDCCRKLPEWRTFSLQIQNLPLELLRTGFTQTLWYLL